MRLIQIRHLLATVEAGSIRGASRALGVTPPALIRNIRALEDELKLKLLDRTAHGVTPTLAGKALLARARNIENELARIQEDAAQMAGGAGSVTFGVAPSATGILPGALAAFRRGHAASEVRIVTAFHVALLPQVREVRIDFALVFAGPKDRLDKRIRVQPLFRVESVIAGRRGHPLAKSKSLADLIDADWLLPSPPEKVPAGLPGNRTLELFRENGLPAPRSIVQCDGAAFYSLLASTDMIGVTTHGNFLQTSGVVQPFKVKANLPTSFTLTISLLTMADSPLTPAAAAMVAAIKAEASKLAFAKAPGK